MNEETKAAMENITKDYCLDQLKYDLIAKLSGRGDVQFLLHEDGKLRPPFRVIDVNTPWIYVRPREVNKCHLWNGILWERLHVLPPMCLDCYKVVVKPRNFKETMMLLELEENHSKRFCKVGFEERDYTFGSWGGYFYCRGKKEGLEVLAEVREMVSKCISPDIKVYLKRGCTEFEMNVGPSSQWEELITEDAYVWADLIDRHVEYPKFQGMPGMLKLHVMARWAKEAYKMGDPTVLEFNMEDPEAAAIGGHLYKPMETYEKEGE